MTRLFAIGSVLVVLSSGCGGDKKPAAAQGHDEAALRVQHVVDGLSVYIEGSIWHVRVVGSDGTAVLDRRLADDNVSLSLEPGRYELESEEFPCDGNCSNLGAAMDSCSTEFDAEPGATLAATVTLRPSKGCAVEFAPQPAA